MKPTRSSAHLRFIRSLPRIVCAQLGLLKVRTVQACHAPGLRGMAQKRSDLDTIPMCALHHSEQHRVGWPQFIRTYDLDIHELLKQLREKPRFEVREIPAVWIAIYRGKELRLTRTAYGFTSSLECAKDLCRDILIDEVFRSKVEAA